MIRHFTTPAHVSQREENEGLDIRVSINSFLSIASKIDWYFIKIYHRYSVVEILGVESFPNCIVRYFNFSNSKLRNISEAFYIPV